MNSMPFRQLKSFFKILIGVQYQSLRDSSPRVGAKGEEVAPNFTENHPKTHWCGSTYGSLV